MQCKNIGVYRSELSSVCGLLVSDVFWRKHIFPRVSLEDVLGQRMAKHPKTISGFNNSQRHQRDFSIYPTQCESIHRFLLSVCETWRVCTENFAAGAANTCVSGVTCRFMFWEDTVLILRVSDKEDQNGEMWLNEILPTRYSPSVYFHVSWKLSTKQC